ncbi:MAG: FAD-dependent oxidoreductase [Ardenticatenaceae bacterium]|nr:FAD-dependent oxidoreductase [Ardenticatenaceae bacterium]
MRDLIIIGGGPAGLAAAAYALHLRLDTLVVAPELGGKVASAFALRGLPDVETVHGGDLVRSFAARIDESPEVHEPRLVRAVEPVEGGFSVRLVDDDRHTARAIILATGARPRRLYVPGEEAFWGRGVSFSAISHAPLFAGRRVAVVGSGESAQVAALELARMAEWVYLITRRAEEVREPYGALLAARPNITLFRGWEVGQIEGDEFVTGIALLGRDGATRTLAVEGVFVELGLIPESDFVANLVARDEQGRIKVDHRARTSRPGVFAAGDVTDVYAEQVPIAIGEGAKAALSAWEYLVTQS